MLKRRESKEFNNRQVIDIEAARQKRKERRELSAAGRALKQTEEEPTRRRSIKNLRRRIIYGLALIAVAVIIGTSVFNVISLKMEEAHAKAELSALKAEKKALQEELSVVDSKEYIEQQAREQLRMIQPGETLYVLKKREKAEDETAN